MLRSATTLSRTEVQTTPDMKQPTLRQPHSPPLAGGARCVARFRLQKIAPNAFGVRLFEV
jgi:hypothetical protein